MRRVQNLILAFAGLALIAVLTSALQELWPLSPGLQEQVDANLEKSGVYHGITAVLLNFRSYDTWMELGVLWAGVMAVLAARGEQSLRSPTKRPADSLLDRLVRLLFPVMVLCAGYLLWLGKFSSGGAFQAGVVLGAGFILLSLAAVPNLTQLPPWALNGLLTVGFMGFLLAAVLTLVQGKPMLELPPRWAGEIILAIEALATVSIAASLPVLFAGLQSSARREEQEQQ